MRSRRGYTTRHPVMGKTPIGPAGAVGGPSLPQVPNPFADFQAAVIKGIQTATSDAVGAGEVFLGVVLVLAGLLIATGQLGRAGRAGVAVGRTAGAARSFIR